MINSQGDMILAAVGDIILVDREDPEANFALAGPLLADADLAFCQLETMFSDRGTLNPIARAPMRARPGIASALRKAGFDVVSCAGNHSMDWGPDALLDTLEVLEQQGMIAVGAGKDLNAARRPAVLEKKGTKLAFLAYNSILAPGYEATERKPGCSPLRAFTVYDPIEPDQPGQPARIHTFAHREDLEQLKRDIEGMRASADILVVSLHFGLHLVRAKLADYQREVAHAAIDAGADLVLGHHAHILKGIEVYKGKVIFYSLGNFVMDRVVRNEPARHSRALEELMETLGVQMDPEWSKTKYPFPADSRKTMIVRCAIRRKHIEEVSFLPCMINRQAQPELLSRADPRFEDVVEYMRQITKEAGLNAKFEVSGDEVVISGDN